MCARMCKHTHVRLCIMYVCMCKRTYIYVCIYILLATALGCHKAWQLRAADMTSKATLRYQGAELTTEPTGPTK